MRTVQAKSGGNSHVHRRKINLNMLGEKRLQSNKNNRLLFFFEDMFLSKTNFLFNVRAIHTTMTLLWLRLM